MNAKAKKVEEALADVPVLDIHTHLVGGKLGARGLHDVLLYHMVVSDLYAAGCPNGARLTQYPGWPDKAEARQRIEQGQYSMGDALKIAEAILYESPQQLLGMQPRNTASPRA